MNAKSMVMVGLGAALAFGLTGCGKSPEKEFENLIRTSMKEGGAPAAMIDAQVKEALKGFKEMTPAEQKKELEKSKALLESIKNEK